MGGGFDDLGVAHEALAGLGQLVALGAALEERCLQALFQRPDPPRHGGMVNVELARRRRQLAGAGNRQEEPEVVPIEALH